MNLEKIHEYAIAYVNRLPYGWNSQTDMVIAMESAMKEVINNLDKYNNEPDECSRYTD